MQRTWLLQSPARLQVLAIQTVDGNTDLGFTSINPGAPVTLSVQIVNTGDAVVDSLQSHMVFKSGGVLKSDGLSATLLGMQPTRIGHNQTATATYQVTAPENIVSGLEFFAYPLVAGVDINSGLAVETDIDAITAQRIVASSSDSLR